MTRSFRSGVNCPHCGKDHTAETAFERWMRNERGLDSVSEAIVRFDIDVLIHCYRTFVDLRGTRELQLMMFVEVKSFGADVTDAQRDTLSMLNQVLRNRKDNIHKKKSGRHAGNHVPPSTVFSHLLGREVGIRMYGGHLLQMSGDSPATSKWLKWDWKFDIDPATLVELLRFDRDPDTMKKDPDIRRRSCAFKKEIDDMFPEIRNWVRENRRT